MQVFDLLLIDCWCLIGLAPRALEQRLNTAILDRGFVAVEGVA
jgi:hypothetical protein